MDRLTATRVFVEVVERGSQTAAAEALEMSRAMVSRYLAELEGWVGARLLHRTTRKLSLTGAGEQLLGQCREMLAVAEAMQGVSQGRNDAPRGNLRIACSQSFAQAWLVHALNDFTDLHPQVSVDLLVGSQAVNLVEARIDLALRITNQLDPNLIARQLAVCRSLVCASPAYLAKHGTPLRPEDLAQHNCLSYAYFGRSIWEFTRAGEPHAVAVSGNLSANESMVLLEAALAGGGISLQPRYSVSAHLRSGALVQLLPDYEPQQLGIHALYGTRRQMPPALRALLDFLLERLVDRPDWDH
ncbi:LysR family transcriptional regulator [Pseudomonas sp. EA_105y_Pfl2_R69]|jgi:DNA-binding transcriptional LysR family regulator|uniref:LysR family transcriptional regulator n=1 Tax=Pseudomonas sp. EA_105y_Pfl2_R69 TaxID=3088683 RepID=UPI0030DAB9E4